MKVDIISFSKNYDDSILESLMYQHVSDELSIFDSGNTGDERIYRALKEIEIEFKTKF
jgi:hypothetical protein